MIFVLLKIPEYPAGVLPSSKFLITCFALKDKNIKKMFSVATSIILSSFLVQVHWSLFFRWTSKEIQKGYSENSLITEYFVLF